jgi:hypothetical protein
VQAELAAARKSLTLQESIMRKMSEQLLKEGEAVISLKAELAKEQGLVKTLRDRLSKVGGGRHNSVVNTCCIMLW